MSRIAVDVLVPVAATKRWRFPEACHLFHLDYDLEALDRFAARIGLRREWRHDAPGFVHYDLNKSTRRRAVWAGARELSRRDPEYVAFVRARSARLGSQGR